MANVAARRPIIRNPRSFPVGTAARVSHAAGALLVVVAPVGGSRDREPAAAPAISRAGRPDRDAANGPRPSRWDRLIHRIAGNRPPSPAVEEADAILGEHIAAYNRVRRKLGEPELRREDFADLLGRPDR